MLACTDMQSLPDSQESRRGEGRGGGFGGFFIFFYLFFFQFKFFFKTLKDTNSKKYSDPG